MTKEKDKRTGTLAIRISTTEHKRLKALAVKLDLGEAETVRKAVNIACGTCWGEEGPVFRE